MARVGAMTDSSTATAVDSLWRCRDKILNAGNGPLIMGIINITADSFSDGGETPDTESAVERALAMLADGADLIDVGGESSRPGALPIDADEEIRRVVPVIHRLASQSDAVISVDTTKAAVARAALDAGARIVNDITALTGDPLLAELVASTDAGLVLMHMRGNPQNMQNNPLYNDVVTEVAAYLRERMTTAVAAGINPQNITFDPGIGFGKTTAHNLALLTHLKDVSRAVGDRPIVIGLSRKRFLGALTGGDHPPRERLAAGLAATAIALWQGAAVVRTHDVKATRDAAMVAHAMRIQAGRNPA